MQSLNRMTVTGNLIGKTKKNGLLNRWGRGEKGAGREWMANSAHPQLFHDSHSFTSSKAKGSTYPVSAMISGATYVGVPQTVYRGPSTMVARPKSPNLSDLLPSWCSYT